MPGGDGARNNPRSVPRNARDQGGTMSFEDVLTTFGRWSVAVEALAAVGAELALAGAEEPGDPGVVRALRGVSAAAGLPDLDQLPPPQRELLTALIRFWLRQAQD